MAEDPLRRLHAIGQSPWLDFIDRDLVRSRRLAVLVEAGARGVTANHAIFERANAHSYHYDEEIKRRAQAGQGAGTICEALALADVRDAADVLRPVHETSE